MRRFTSVTMLILGAALPLAAASTPLRVVPAVDLTRYAGTWYEVARLPNRFQTKCAGEVVARYEPRPDGRITVVNRCRTTKGDTTEATGVARRVEGQPPSILEVRFAPAFLGFLPAVWGDYRIIALDPDYRHAVVGTPDRAYLWVLSRTPQIDRTRYEQLLGEARAQGFDVTKVVETPQRARAAS
jgi:apolipoprotein D and lipocalin family protein